MIAVGFITRRVDPALVLNALLDARVNVMLPTQDRGDDVTTALRQCMREFHEQYMYRQDGLHVTLTLSDANDRLTATVE